MYVLYNSNSPRVLVVGMQFSASYGSGIYSTDLFSAWPQDKLATISGTMLPQNWDRCCLHYCTGDAEIQISKPFNRLVAKKKSGPIKRNGNICENNTILLKKDNESLLNRIVKGVRNKLFYLIGGRELLYRVVVSKQLTDWVSAFKPEVLYGVCSDYNSLRFFTVLHKTLNIPLVLHVMDDWASTLYSQGPAKYTIRPRYVKEYKKLMQQADVAIAICENMAEEYSARYKRPVISFPIPVNLDAYKMISRTQWGIGKPFRIRYGGRVGWAIRDSLADFAIAVDQLCKEGYDIVFEIATNQTDTLPAVCSELECVEIVKLSPLEELPSISAQCDLHLICYDFDDASKKQARYSMPGKLPACMASGTPIMVYGPACLPVVEYARNEEWGSIVSSRDQKILKDQLRELMENELQREKYGKKARELAFKKHDARVVSENFGKVVTSLVSKQ